MKKSYYILILLFLLNFPRLLSQTENDTVIYLLTCGPGIETYSVYGHSALCVVVQSEKSNTVYNWGMFDFSTPNFAWNFATGRLSYSLGTSEINGFLESYFYEKRYVISQKINLTESEKLQLIALINENLKPENVQYRYDFFYDDCSTRIRDLLEKVIGQSLLYPPVEIDKPPTFRQMTGKYQAPYQWYKFGVDLIMGSSGDKKALFRDRMFLPIDMQEGLSKAVISRDGKMIPLLQNPEVILDFDAPSIKKKFLSSPVSVFTALMIIVIILTGIIKKKSKIRLMDIIIYTVFSILSILMIFFNFFTGHAQMKWNLNLLWLNPFIIVCLLLVLLGKTSQLWFRILFIFSAAFLIFHFFLPQEFNLAFLPLAVILLVRSSARAGFEWNPFSLQ